MLKRAFVNKKKWIAIPLVGIMSASIIAGVFYNSSEVAHARASLPKIETIVQGNSSSQPFKILEIVPKYEDAKFGYLVAGQEPVFYDDNRVLALDDMASAEERAERYPSDRASFDSNLNTFASKSIEGENLAYTWEDGFMEYADAERSHSIYGEFVEGGKDYQKVEERGDSYLLVGGTGNLTISEVLDPTNTLSRGQLYMDNVSFNPVNNNATQKGYGITLRRYKEEDRRPFKVSIPSLTNPFYDWNYYVPSDSYIQAEPVKDDTDNIVTYKIAEGQNISIGRAYYTMDSLGNMEFYGHTYLDETNPDDPVSMFTDKDGDDFPLEADDISDKSLANKIGIAGIELYTVDVLNVDADSVSNKYIIDSVYSIPNGFISCELFEKSMILDAGHEAGQYGIYTDDDFVNDHDMYYLLATVKDYVFDNSDPIYANKLGSVDFAQSFSGAEVDSFNYEGGFTNNEWFKKMVLDRDQNQLKSTVVDVITKTAADVTVEDVVLADLIYIQNAPYAGRSKDISADVAKRIILESSKNKPIILEGYGLHNDIYDSVGKAIKESSESGQVLDDMYKLVLGLSQYRLDSDLYIKEVWEEEDATKLSENLLKYEKTDLSRVEDLCYVIGSVFVYSPSDSVVGPKFTDTLVSYSDYKADKYNQTEVDLDDIKYTVGIADVLKDIDTEYFYLWVDDSTTADSIFNKEASIATCIRHILSVGDRRVTSKDKLEVLDIEPFYSEVYEKNTSLFNNIVVKSGTGFTNVNGAYKYNENDRDIFSKNWFIKYGGTQIKDADNIVVTGMGTREFIGKIEDIKKYDLIYIGLDTQYMNTEMEKNNTVKTHTPVYNIPSMKGKVYTHIGDELNQYWDNAYNGDRYLWDDFLAGSNAWDGSGTHGRFRSSGNDITFEKLRELRNYVEAGYAILLSDDFFDYNSDGTIKEVNSEKIDPNSYMYDFATWLLYGEEIGTNKSQANGFVGKNVAVKSMLGTSGMSFDVDVSGRCLINNKTYVENREEFSNYLNISKLVINYLVDKDGNEIKPTPYYDEDAAEASGVDKDKLGTYLVSDANGIYSLNFGVELQNYAATNTENTSYNCKLFIDHDADGRFEKLEALSGLNITNQNGDAAPFDQVNGIYKLKTGEKYFISRRVPEGYVGFLSWKLVFYENDRAFEDADPNSENNLIEAAKYGYSAVPDYNLKPEINILQITFNQVWQAETTLDLTSTKMEDLYKKVRDFDIKVKKINYRDLVNNKNGEYYGDNRQYSTLLEYMMSYDMLVMGFNDMFYSANVDDHSKDLQMVYAVRSYALSGKSVLFTHDLNSMDTSKSAASWGSLSNTYLRDIQGMDRYGLTRNNLSNLSSIGPLEEYKSRYDNDGIDTEEGYYTDIFNVASHKSTDANHNLIDNYGWLDTQQLRFNYTGGTNNPIGYGTTCFPSVYDKNAPGVPYYEYNQTTITQLNQGQITEYPFHIDTPLTVATTHPQYFQLNLDTDSQDKNTDDDVVVWYTISNKNNGLNPDREKIKANSKVNFYTADYNDARNNYYIYNKGNITYTGSGHSNVDGLPEMKLFVNTLVAAYNAGDHAPFVKYKKSGWDQSADITSMYEPYDEAYSNGYGAAEGGFTEGNITVYFKTINNNIRNNIVENAGVLNYAPLNVEYYVETSQGAAQGAAGRRIGTGADAKYLKRIAPISVTPVMDSNGAVLNVDALENPYVLQNYTIYKAEFKVDDFGGTTVNGKKVELNRNNAKLYIGMTAEELKEDTDIWRNYDSLPASQSLNGLEIDFISLKELK